MQHATSPTTDTRRLSGDWLLWYGVLSSPIAWSGHLLLAYLLVSTACDAGQTAVRLMIGALTIGAVALIVAGGIAGYARWRPEITTGAGAADSGRRRFMGLLAVMESGLFVVATLFTAAPAFALQVCG